MKRKRLSWLGAVALLAVVTLAVILFWKAGGEKEQRETTQPTQQTTQPAPTAPEILFENRMFTFTASQFREWFAHTLPDGYVFGDQMINNPDRDNNLQLDIYGSDGVRTGIAILLNVKDSQQAFCQMALTVGKTDDVKDFSALINWYVTTFLVSLRGEEQKSACKTFVELFESGMDDYKLLSSESQTAMMVLEEEGDGHQYYVMIGVG